MCLVQTSSGYVAMSETFRFVQTHQFDFRDFPNIL